MASKFFRTSQKFSGLAAVLLGAGTLSPSHAAGQLPVPIVPEPPVIGSVLGPIERETRLLATQAERKLQQARRNTISELLREHKAVLERDPQGELVVRGELMVFEPSDQALERALDAGFSLLRKKRLQGLGTQVMVLQVPRGWSTRYALRRLKKLDPDGIYDFNHLFLPGGRESASERTPSDTGLAPARPLEPNRLRVGLVDGGIDVQHPVFSRALIEAQGCDGKPVPSTHGTAVASLLIGDSEEFRGAIPGAVLYAVDIYCGRPTGGAVDEFAAALAWLASRDVAVINTSIVGPPNRILESVVRVLADRGHVLVAAVGNDGPAARPLYPAGYPGVVAVTGVRSDRRVLPEAGRGSHVDFSAPGADMLAASLRSSHAEVRGTSYAAPLVAGLIAALMDVPDPARARAAIRELAAVAIDLGKPGRDEIFGEGLVAEELRIAP